MPCNPAVQPRCQRMRAAVGHMHAPKRYVTRVAACLDLAQNPPLRLHSISSGKQLETLSPYLLCIL